MNNEFGWFNIILSAFGVKKIRLISYTSEPLNPLCDRISCILNLRTTWMWGMLGNILARIIKESRYGK